MTSTASRAALGPDSATAADLGRVIGRLRRAVNRKVRAEGPQLRESHIEILRVVNQSPCRIQDVADQLHLAHNTVSTASQQMVDDGLLERLRDDSDRRVVRLRLTESAEQHIDQWRRNRARILAQHIEQLPATDQKILDQAMPVLDRLAHSVESNA